MYIDMSSIINDVAKKAKFGHIHSMSIEQDDGDLIIIVKNYSIKDQFVEAISEDLKLIEAGDEEVLKTWRTEKKVIDDLSDKEPYILNLRTTEPSSQEKKLGIIEYFDKGIINSIFHLGKEIPTDTILKNKSKLLVAIAKQSGYKYALTSSTLLLPYLVKYLHRENIQPICAWYDSKENLKGFIKM